MVISFKLWLAEADSYYDLGHSGGIGDALWWMTKSGTIEVITLKRQGEGTEVRHMRRMKEGWYGRYDKGNNEVSVVGGDYAFSKEVLKHALSITFPSASIIFFK